MKPSVLTMHFGLTLGEEKNIKVFGFFSSTLPSLPFNYLKQKQENLQVGLLYHSENSFVH